MKNIFKPPAAKEPFSSDLKTVFNFVENSWWSKKNHQYDNFKRKLYKFLILLVNFFIR